MAGLNHDTAARLLGVSPGELESLVKAGSVRRSGRDDYALPVLIQDYIGHLKGERDRAEFAPKQADIAVHLDLSERSVREFLDASGIDHKQVSLSDIRIAYVRRQREIASGRATIEGGLELAAERAGLAKAQRERIEMQNAVTRRELAPVILIEEVLAKAGGKVAGILDAIPGMIKRRVPSLTSDDLDLIAGEVAKARNIAAAIRLDDLIDEAQEKPEAPELDEVIE